MLAFYLNNKPFAVDSADSVRLSWRNPACNIKDFPGDIGLGIEIPVNDINRELLGNPERFERYAENNIREFAGFEIRYGGVLLMQGTLIINSAGEDKYSAWLRSDIGNIGKEHREKFIFESKSFLEQERTFENKSNYDPLTDHYACPKIFNSQFFYDKGRKLKLERYIENPQYADMNWWQDLWNTVPAYITEAYETEDLTESFRKTASWTVNYPNPDGTILMPESYSHIDFVHKNLETCVVSPMLFLNYILKTVIKDSGFYLDKNFLREDPDLQKLILYNNFDITHMKHIPSYDIIEWNVKLDNDLYSRGSYTIPSENVYRGYDKTFLYKDLVPEINLKDFFLSTQNLLNVCFFFRPGRKIIDIIDREGILTGTSVDISGYLTGSWEMGDKKDVTIKFSFSHDTNDEYFTDKWEDIDDRREDEKEPVETWEDLENITEPEMGEIRYLKTYNQYVQYNLIQITDEDPVTGQPVESSHLGWERIALGFQNGYYNYGKDEEEEISTKFSTLFGDQTTLAYQRGNIRNKKYAYENFTPRLLFYLGNNTAKFETDTISLDWEKQETGLMYSRWKNWARFWANRQPVSCQAHFPLNMLIYVLNNLYRKFRTREGEFIIEEISTEFGINQIGLTKINGYKINYTPQVHYLSDLWRYMDDLIIDTPIDFESTITFYL